MERPLLRHLAWDSEFFGVAIARTLSPRLRPHEIDIILRECEQTGIKCLYCELDPEEMDTVFHVQGRSFTFVEFRLVMRHDLLLAAEDAPAFRTEHAAELDDCPRPEDLADLSAIADAISPMSRFAVDPRFGADASRRLYARWLHSCIEDPAVKMIVARLKGRVVGFVTIKPDGVAGDAAGSTSGGVQLTLLGVAPDAQGRGIGVQLARAAVQAAAAKGAARLDVVTQGRNIRAVRTYERAGFVLAAGTCYFHKWWE